MLLVGVLLVWYMAKGAVQPNWLCWLYLPLVIFQLGLLGFVQFEGAALQLGQHGAFGAEAYDEGVHIPLLHRPKPVELHGLMEDDVALLHGVHLIIACHLEQILHGVHHFPKGMEFSTEVIGVPERHAQAIVQRGDAQDRGHRQIMWHEGSPDLKL